MLIGKIKILFLIALVFLSDSFASATTTTAISNNVAGMRQLSPANIVQQYPGAAPYYGPSICQQQLSNFQAQMGPGYSCTCPQNAQTPVCTPICSALLPTYQQNAGAQYNCTCPSANVIPVCTKLSCGQLLAQYQAQYPYPAYTCSCPSGSGSSTQPACSSNPTCAQMLYSFQAGYGPNYTCSCPSCSGSPTDSQCYATPTCNPIVKSCTFNLSSTTRYGTFWSCSGTQIGNNLSYSCNDSGGTSLGSAISTVYTYSGYLTPGQCQTWSVPWLSCQDWMGVYNNPYPGWVDPNNGVCNYNGAPSCNYNYNPQGVTGGTWGGSAMDKYCPNGTGSLWGQANNPVCWTGSQLSIGAADGEVFSSSCN